MYEITRVWTYEKWWRIEAFSRSHAVNQMHHNVVR